MNRGWRPLSAALSVVVAAALLTVTVAGATPEPACSGAPVAMRPITIAVEGEYGTGRAYEPYRCVPGDLAPRQLIVAVHGHGESAAEYPDLMEALARRTGAPVLTLDQRGGESTWKTGEFNVWAGWHDVVAATQQYRADHPSIDETVLWGWSQGAITSGLAVANGPRGLFDYWVENYGPTNLFAFWDFAGKLPLPIGAEVERDAGGCTPAVCPQAYADRSLTMLAPKLDAQRIILVHGTADPAVLYQNSVDLRAALVAAGKPVSFYTVVTGRDRSGLILPGSHGIGPAWLQGACAVQRLLADEEPLDGPVRDYRTDVLAGIDTAPASSTNCGI